MIVRIHFWKDFENYTVYLNSEGKNMTYFECYYSFCTIFLNLVRDVLYS